MKYLKSFTVYALNRGIQWLFHIVLNSEIKNIGCFISPLNCEASDCAILFL